MNFLVAFFAGAFLCNGLPHLLAGLHGRPFPTPFATPSGVGDSSPIVNFLWGSFNLAVGVALLCWRRVPLAFDSRLAVFAVGFVVTGLLLARHFGNVHRNRGGDRKR